MSLDLDAIEKLVQTCLDRSAMANCTARWLISQKDVKVLGDTVKALVAEVRRLRAENDSLKHSIVVLTENAQ